MEFINVRERTEERSKIRAFYVNHWKKNSNGPKNTQRELNFPYQKMQIDDEHSWIAKQ